ncbi:DNA helicase [Desulfomarina profundi]|uniref:DNA 3'-5' helicase n=1 Tax=Desulfomarina profundi TaxID=2772557 RepID=A0A8D5FSK7_9BACT|nr:3'-5' exonuclease [Desulfomarina profundi]BCL62895.1 DNA helicase [Desulfomarina profundi]
MEFRIADTFTDSLAKLTGREQKAVKTTAFDLQMNPANPGLKFHRLDRVKDPNFWSVRVNADIRLIVHKTYSSLMLCYVGHHDKAYSWAERRKLETHPKTGAAQLVEVRELVKEIIVPKFVEEEQTAPVSPPLFSNVSDEELLSYGVPEEWLNDVRLATEDSLLNLVEHLPAEAAEALLELAVGETPAIPELATSHVDPFNHPDARRRFRVMSNVDELERALEYPWEKWTVFLHPDQRQIVEKEYNGPARVSGSAGTGKTIVALHRAVFLARNHPDARVLLTTFSNPLANALETKLRRLISHEPKLAERIDVRDIATIGKRLYGMHCGPVNLVSEEMMQELIEQAGSTVTGHKFSNQFLLSEWRDVVDAWQLGSWEDYRDVKRLGRKTRLPEKQRCVLWEIFSHVRSELKKHGWITYAGMFNRVAKKLKGNNNPPFDFVVVDEAQDISVAQLLFMAALGSDRLNALFFAGDLGQRIFQQPFSWKALGVDIRGRSRTLRVNYRTSHQIRMQADRLLAPELSDVDGNLERRGGTVSVFNGPNPILRILDTEKDEIKTVADWLRDLKSDGILPGEIGIFVRSERELERASAAVEAADLPCKILDEKLDIRGDDISISTMHLAKGLEFRVVVVMACDDEVLPSQERIETVADDADLEEVYNTERHLLYVACTRARDRLLVTGVDPASEFIDDLMG